MLGVGLGYIALKKLIDVMLGKTIKNMIFKNKFKINQKNIKKYNLESEICCICLDNYHMKCENHKECSRRGYQLYCNHIFHEKCILEWLDIEAKCPLCNKLIETENEILHKRFEERNIQRQKN